MTSNKISDIQASQSFLKILFKFKPAPGKARALDCGAGIGRVSKNLLMNEFQTVDLVEQDEKFCEKAREALTASGMSITYLRLIKSSLIFISRSLGRNL